MLNPALDVVIIIILHVSRRNQVPARYILWMLCRLVCHAVAASMRSVLQDWNLMVTQLEHQLRTGTLTLQVMTACRSCTYPCIPHRSALPVLAELHCA